MSKRMLGNCLLVLAAMIWGAAFVAQSAGMEYVGPFTFQAVRCLLASLVLLPVIALMDKKGNSLKPVTAEQRKGLWIAGGLCGIFLFIACSLQQLGLTYVAPGGFTPGKSGFITALYIILVPIIGVFLGRKLSVWIGISVVLGIAGLYLLCGGGSFSMGPGELLTLGCALAFSFHILTIDRLCGKVDGVRLSCLQFLVCSILSAVCMVIWETPNWDGIFRCWLPIAYTGILSAGVGYTLQIIAQAHTEPAVASLLMSLESVFSVIFTWIIMGQGLSGSEWLGCWLVFGGVILAQLPAKEKKER